MNKRIWKLDAQLKKNPQSVLSEIEDMLPSLRDDQIEFSTVQAIQANALVQLNQHSEANALANLILSRMEKSVGTAADEARCRCLLVLLDTSEANQRVPLLSKLVALRKKIPCTPLKGHCFLAESYWSRMMGDLKRSISCCEKAIEIFKACGFKMGLAGAQNNLAVEYYSIGELEKSLSILLQAESLSQEIKDDLSVGRSIINQAMTLRAMGDLEGSRQKYESALALMVRLDEKVPQAYCLNGLGSVCIDLGQPSEAAGYFRRSIELKETFGLKVDQVSSYLNLGQSELMLGAFNDALVAYEKAKVIADMLDDKRHLWAVELGLAKTQKELGEIEKAIVYYQSAYSIVVKQGLRKEKIEVLMELANLAEFPFSEMDLNLLNAIVDMPVRNICEFKTNILKTAEEEARAIGAKAVLCKLLEIRSQFEEEEGRLETALRYLKEHLQLKGEIKEEEALRQMRAMSIRHQVEDAQRRADIEHLRTVKLEKVNHELRKLNDEKDTFVGILAHDLRNPLGGIRGIAGGLVAKEKDPFRKQIFKDMEETTGRMLEIIERLLDFSRMNSNSSEEKIDVEISNVVKNVIHLSEAHAQRKDIFIYSVIEEGLRIYAKSGPCFQLVENILSNAIKFSPQNGRVECRLFSNSESVCMQIIDTGPGFSREDLGRLFQPFAKLSATPTGSESSSGLGLTIIKRMAEETGAVLHYENRMDGGVGACINVEWPIR